MHSQSGMAGNPRPSPSPENSPSREYPLDNLNLRYKDEEPRQPRDSHEHDHNDIELGNVPLLPAGLDYENRESSEWDFSEEGNPFIHDPPFSCTAAGFCAWLRGPTPPHVYHVHPWFPRWQAAPARLVDRWAPTRIRKIALLAGALLLWIGVFFSTLKAFTASQEVPGYGQPVRLSCHHRLWYVGARFTIELLGLAQEAHLDFLGTMPPTAVSMAIYAVRSTISLSPSAARPAARPP